MKYIFLALSWVFGVLFLLGGIAAILQSPLAGLSLILASLLLLPPVRNFVHKKTNNTLQANTRGVLLVILFVAFGFFMNQSEEALKAEKAAQEEKAKAEKIAADLKNNIDYFSRNSTKVLNEIKQELKNGNYNKVLSLTKKYLPTKNEELIALQNKANEELKVIKNAKKTKEILAELKGIPSSQQEKNRDLYKELVSLNPKVKEYEEKYNFYNSIIEKKEKERQAKIAKFGNPPIKSAWDGSYREVERYLQRVANDPDSIKVDGCTKVFFTSNGWLVGCDYRGRNAFGGMIRQSNWFTIAHGTVIKMEDASAYKN